MIYKNQIEIMVEDIRRWRNDLPILLRNANPHIVTTPGFIEYHENYTTEYYKLYPDIVP